MTISIQEFADVEEKSGLPLFPAVHRQMGQALTTFHQVSANGARCVRVHNDDGSTAVHVRVTVADTVGNEAVQGDLHIAANSYETFHIRRGDRPYIYALADT